MTKIRLRYVKRYTDRHGQLRHYFRKPGHAGIALPGLPGSAEFMEAYRAALGGSMPAPSIRTPVGVMTIDMVLDRYFRSPTYLTLAPSTKAAYKRVFTRWVKDEGIGHRPIKTMRREHVEAMIGKRENKPGATNVLLKKIRLLMAFAIRNNWRTDDPTIKIPKFETHEWHTWTEAEIGLFEKHHRVGSKAWLVYTLLLYTGQRISDVATMEWTHIAGSRISVVQEKTKERLWIPIHPALSGSLRLAPRVCDTIVSTEYQKPFSIKGLSNWMADRIDEAGLSDRCISHGLRKAAARRLAEAGCSSKEIAAITGHRSLAEVERYTRAAEQMRLADAAMARLEASSAV